MNELKGLCHRCEYRAVYLETGNGPRYECKQSDSVHSCYMYRPVQPVTLERNPADTRDVGLPPMIGPRYHRGEKPDMLLSGQQIGENTILLWWSPDTVPEVAE